jgi:hypothetical protein
MFGPGGSEAVQSRQRRGRPPARDGSRAQAVVVGHLELLSTSCALSGALLARRVAGAELAKSIQPSIATP